MGDFIIVPDLQIFETCYLARKEGKTDNSWLKLLISAWRYYIDSREKVICITGNLGRFLVDKRYKSAKEKRLALSRILRIKDDFSDTDHDMSQLKLAAKLSIEEDKEIYYVTDNSEMKEILMEIGFPFQVIGSKDALELFNKSSPPDTPCT